MKKSVNFPVKYHTERKADIFCNSFTSRKNYKRPRTHLVEERGWSRSGATGRVYGEEGAGEKKRTR